MSLLQDTTGGSDYETSRRRKEIKVQKKLVKCLRGRDLRNDCVVEEKWQTRDLEGLNSKSSSLTTPMCNSEE